MHPSACVKWTSGLSGPFKTSTYKLHYCCRCHFRVFFRVCIERGEWILCCPWEQRSLMCGACALKLLVCISFQVLHHYLDFSRVSSSCPLAALLLSHSIVSFVFVFLLVCMWQTGREPRVCWGFCSCCFPLRQWRSLSATSLPPCPHRSFLSTMVTWDEGSGGISLKSCHGL